MKTFKRPVALSNTLEIAIPKIQNDGGVAFLLEKFKLKLKTLNKSSSTVPNYFYTIRKFLRYFGKLDCSDLDWLIENKLDEWLLNQEHIKKSSKKRVLIQKIGILYLQKILGHRNILTTEQYLNPDFESIKKAYDRLMPNMVLTGAGE
ncbi:MAG: hypothetical protein QXG01_07560 [Candidatus Bathyarchaeia archaeon]